MHFYYGVPNHMLGTTAVLKVKEKKKKDKLVPVLYRSTVQAWSCAGCSGAHVGLHRSFVHQCEHIRAFTPTWNDTFD